MLNSFFDPEPRISKGCDRSGHTRDLFLLLKFLRPAGESHNFFLADIAEYTKEKMWYDSQKLHGNPDGTALFEADVAYTKDFKAWIMR